MGPVFTQLKPIQAKRKAPAVAAAIRSMLAKASPGQKLPTIKGLCRSLNVAIGTLDSALYDLERQGVILRENGSGIYVSPWIHCKSIGLVFGFDIFKFGQSPFYSMLLEYCRRRAASHHEQFSFYLDVPAASWIAGEVPVHRQLVEALEQKKLHGILLPNRWSLEQARWLQSQGVAVVSMSADIHEVNCVGLDYAELVRLGVRSLATQGCRRIGLIRALPAESDGSEAPDIRAYRETLTKMGRPWRGEWICQMEDSGKLPREEQGDKALIKLLNTPLPRLDGLVIEDDMMTHGALAAAKKMGLQVGAEIKIATHANKGSPVLCEHEDVLTLLEVDPGEVAEAMFEMLERLMARSNRVEKAILIRPKKQTNEKIK